MKELVSSKWWLKIGEMMATEMGRVDLGAVEEQQS